MNFQARTIRLIMELRRQGIHQTSVLSAIEKVPRELFVPQNFHDKAYEDTALPIGCGQTISQPYIVAMMTQALELTDRHSVLEIGTGSGYQAAVLANLCRRVYTIERLRSLHDQAQSRFENLKLRNITTQFGDGYKGWASVAPFDRMIITAGADQEPPPELLAQLAVGGIMVLPVKLDALNEQLVKLTKKADDDYDVEKLMDVRFVPLINEQVMR
jgi:protein-L-isoaspartate(D-aspartate) O-methyltransferase